MATRAERARSFGSIAADYDRLRPTAPPEALDWIVPANCAVAVDLAAGTGLFTRPLAERVPRVIAVEPDPQMRAILTARTPGVEVMAGTGESIPLPDASVDAVFVSSAWHWFDAEVAIAEIARVLRDGGRLGVLATSRDPEVDWVRALDRPPDFAGRDAADAADAADRDKRRHRYDVDATSESLFEHRERTTFSFERPMGLDDAVEMIGTYSVIITASPEDRERQLAIARQILSEHYDGANEIAMPMRSWCWRGDRRPR